MISKKQEAMNHNHYLRKRKEDHDGDEGEKKTTPPSRKIANVSQLGIGDIRILLTQLDRAHSSGFITDNLQLCCPSGSISAGDFAISYVLNRRCAKKQYR
jgi:hypothetical protein